MQKIICFFFTLLILLYSNDSKIIKEKERTDWKISAKLTQRLEKAKKSFYSIHGSHDLNAFKSIVDEVLAGSGDYKKFNKGRKTEDTKAILNYAISTLYNLKQKKNDFDSNKFFDEVFDDNSKIYSKNYYIFYKVLTKPDDILPEGLFEGDIVLTKEQAADIFSKYIEHNKTFSERKVTNYSGYLWQMPISYLFDGTHC
jgi:hypothetical protein